jgi:AcrR family transcriptional regulator
MEEKETGKIDCDWRARLRAALRDRMSEKQVSILIAAAELFSEKGFSATTTKEIARRAGVAEGSVFKQHTSKDVLFATLSESIATHILAPLLGYGLDALFRREFDSPEDLFRALFRNRMELFGKNAEPIRLLLLELPYRPDLRAFFLSTLRATPLFDALGRLKEKGFLPARSAEDILRILITCFAGFFLTRFLLFPEYFSEEIEADAERFVQFLAKGLKPDAQRPPGTGGVVNVF